MIGLVVGAMVYVPINIVHVSWYPVGRFLPLFWLVSGMVYSVVGALVAGALYKEKGEGSPSTQATATTR